MKVTVQSIHFNADQKLIQFVQQRVDRITRQCDDIISGEVALSLDKAHEGTNKVAEIKFKLPASSMVAKKQRRTFEEAIDISMDAIRSQLERYKNKRRHR